MIIINDEHVTLDTPTGPMRTHIVRPAAPGRYPGILFYSEIFQITAPIRRTAAMPKALRFMHERVPGIDVPPDRVTELERFVGERVTGPRTTQIRHPMRSTWWILPFALCLSAEWWLRRRQGLR